MRFPRWGGLARVVRPHSIRTRVAFVILAAMAVSAAAIFWVFGATVDASTHAEIERALQQQANAVARTIDSTGPRDAARSARQAQRFMGDVRMVVSVADEVVYYSGRETDVEARATGHSGDVAVLLERPDPQARAVEPWFFYTLVAGSLAFIVLVVWYLSGTVARRLRRSVREVAESAEAVTRGRFDVRAPEHDDELGRLAHAFNRMTARLEAADARQREFLADVAHELRTPVTAIDGFATALGDGTARSDETRAEAVEFIRAETARLRDLVRDLQTLTWLDLDPPCAAVPVDLAAAARTTVARVGPDARARGVSLTAADGELWATADPDHVDTILANLTANALNATPTGGSITLQPVTNPGWVAIAVRDTGRGIAPEHLPYVFDRLYRAEQGRPRGPGDGGGSGLGLSIVRRLSTLQGGRVDVASTLGEGTTFTLWLPAGRRPGTGRRAGGRERRRRSGATAPGQGSG